MNAAIRRSRDCCIDVVRAIDQGIGSVDAIAAALPQHKIHDIRVSIHNMRKRFDHIEVVREAHGGRHALYALAVPVEDAIAAINQPRVYHTVTFASLQEALGIPTDIGATLALHAKPRKIAPMGKWEVA